MEAGKIQSSILKWVSDNYMATGEVRQNVCDDLGRAISDEAFYGALFGLFFTSLVTSHIYDSQNAAFASIPSPDEYNPDVLYWRVAENAGG